MIPSIDVLRLAGEVSARLHDEALAAYPREACGFLVGRHARGKATVRRLLVAENRAARRDRFLIDARDVFEAMRSVRHDDSDLLGVYHSHPDAAPVPSAVDRSEAWAEWLYLIVSCRGGNSGAQEMACWRWDGDAFCDVRLDVAGEIGERTS